MELRSKSQVRTIFNSLITRGKLSKENMDTIISFIDLPEAVGARKGGTRSALGGFRSSTRRSSVRKGGVR